MDNPNYSFTEASIYLKIPQPTLHAWFKGRTYPRVSGKGEGYFKPLLKLPNKNFQLLSFNNLIESYVLRSLRVEHDVKIKAVRSALDYAQKEFAIKRLLLHRDLLTNAGELFLERYGALVNLTKSGQIEMREMFKEHLKRIVWNKDRWPVRLYPFIDYDAKKEIAIDPQISFGKPIIARKSISTAAIISRIDAGESMKFVADDYGLNIEEIHLAMRYEKRLAA
ncbi:DUF433 domain-containing protein [bacterium]|nr:DUF433 domain-containing protein [bacterium]RIK73243.1 MAG: hypothetical protein DCC62_17810 [candidate division KSB1 bacterium]